MWGMGGSFIWEGAYPQLVSDLYDQNGAQIMWRKRPDPSTVRKTDIQSPRVEFFADPNIECDTRKVFKT